MKKEKMSFFKKMFLVLTDFRSYPFLIKYEKFYQSFLYLIELVLLVSIILTVNVCEKINNAIVEIIENYDKVIPEFELADGVLDVKSLYNQEIDDNSYLVVDTNYTYEEYKKTNEYSKLVIYDSVILVNKDKITIENLGYPLEGIPTFKEIEMNTDKNGLYEIIKEAYSNTKYKTQAISTIFVSVYFSYFIATFIKILTWVWNFFWERFHSFIISIVRIILAGLLFNGTFAMIYSLIGGLLSFLIMLLAKKNNKFSPIGVSALGGTVHNFGQIIVAAVVMRTYRIIYYFPILILVGLFTGIINGIIANIIIKRVTKAGDIKCQ